jgi:hypothetical protein
MFQICVPNKKNSRKKTNTTFLKLFLNAMIRNIKIYNILNIIQVSKSIEPNKFSPQKNLWKCSFTCFLWFFKVWWVQENQGGTFLIIQPKDGCAQIVFSSWQTFKKLPSTKQGC